MLTFRQHSLTCRFADKVKDLDDFNDAIQEDTKFKNIGSFEHKEKYYGMEFKKMLSDFIISNKNKKIIFVGYNSNWNNWIDIPTSNKFFINLPIHQVIKQRYDREIKIKKKDVSLETIIKWIKNTEDDIKEYDDHGYQFMKPEEIYENISKLIGLI